MMLLVVLISSIYSTLTFLLQMLMVRQTLTEILLEVTNEEIKSIASDTLSKKRSKGNTDQIFTKISFYVMTNRRSNLFVKY